MLRLPEFPLQIADIHTARLCLVAVTAATLDAEAQDPQLLVPSLHARVPAEWPDSNWEPHVFDFIKQQIETEPHTAGWHRYVVLRGTEPTLIGACGAFSKEGNQAEIGYAILQPWQGQGYATEATSAVIAAVFASGTEVVLAQTFPGMAASLRVMEKCGLAFDGPGDEGTVRYRLSRAAG